MNLQKQAQFVMRQAVTLAGQELLNIQPTARKINQTRKDFVTDADILSEKMLISEIQKTFPQIPVYSEECGGEARQTGYLFVFDPIDGTVNFYHQDGYYWGISAALLLDGKTISAVINFPARNKIFFANKEDEFGPRTVSSRGELKETQVWTDWTTKDKTSTLTILRKLNENTIYPQIRLCATAGLMEVATGRIDGYVHPGPSPFDIAAGCLIVEKCGGRVTDMSGNQWNPFSGSIIATNGLIHDKLLEILNK